MKKIVMLPVEIEAEDAAAMINAIRDLKANSSRSCRTTHYSWITDPSGILPDACQSCFGLGGEARGTGVRYCNCPEDNDRTGWCETKPPCECGGWPSVGIPHKSGCVL